MKSNRTNIDEENKFSLFNLIYLLFWGGLILFSLIFAPYSVKTISAFLIILIILLIASGFGSHIIIEEDKIIRKGIFCLSFRSKRIIYFNEIYSLSVKYKIIFTKMKIYTEPIYILKNEKNKNICIIDTDNLPYKLTGEMNKLLLSIIRKNKDIKKDESMIEFSKTGKLTKSKKRFIWHPTFIEIIRNITRALFKLFLLYSFFIFFVVYVLN